jgi:hypothetical protein
VRSVTQGDVIRADAKDIPRIFQVRGTGETLRCYKIKKRGKTEND